uniref:U1-type domain-containing protein n=1 Tax=Oncorhynchus mykiss TaxID=8022 RepID=A0A8K9WM41_ONCMY
MVHHKGNPANCGKHESIWASIPVEQQYPTDYYESGDKLFCKFCQHTNDWTRNNTCDDHLKCKAHVKNKEKHRFSQSMPLQTTISSANFVAVCAESDKLRKLRPLLVKYCKQGGALPKMKAVSVKLTCPSVFDQHMTAILQKI